MLCSEHILKGFLLHLIKPDILLKYYFIKFILILTQGFAVCFCNIQCQRNSGVYLTPNRSEYPCAKQMNECHMVSFLSPYLKMVEKCRELCAAMS